jgi:hypothetical protein
MLHNFQFVSANLYVVSIYAGGNCSEIQWPGFMDAVKFSWLVLSFLEEVTLPVFLESTGFSWEDVPIEERKVGMVVLSIY